MNRPIPPKDNSAKREAARKETTSVKALQKGKVCGWCGKRHESLKCP